MFIVKHKPTGKYYKKGNVRSWWDAKLVDKGEATVFRSRNGAIESLGHAVKKPPVLRGGWEYTELHYVLDEEKWEIEEVTIQ